MAHPGGLAIENHICRHGTITHFSADRCIGAALRVYGEWAEAEIALLASYLRRGDTVLDVGANVGTHTLAFAKLIGPAGRVLALEAQPEIFCLLAHNVVQNNLLGPVQPLNCIAGDRTGLKSWKLVPGQAQTDSGITTFHQNESLDAPGTADTLELKLPQIRLDDLGLETCALIKIDVEGMERPVLLGAEQLLRTCQPIIYFEHASGNAAEIVASVRLLERCNYTLYWHETNPFNRNNYRRHPLNIFGGATELNVFALPAGAVKAPSLPKIVDPRCSPVRKTPEEAMSGVAIDDYLSFGEQS